MAFTYAAYTAHAGPTQKFFSGCLRHIEGDFAPLRVRASLQGPSSVLMQTRQTGRLPGSKKGKGGKLMPMAGPTGAIAKCIAHISTIINMQILK